MTRQDAVQILQANGIAIHDCNYSNTRPIEKEKDIYYMSDKELNMLLRDELSISEKINGKPRATKKAIYAAQGIVFDGKHIVSPIGLINEMLKEGNDKTGKHVWTFSMVPGTMSYEFEKDGIIYHVIGTCVCNCNGCYAMTGRYVFDDVKRSMAINTYLVNHHLNFVFRCIAAQLEYIGRGEIRIHAAGDFNTSNSVAYAVAWYNIAKKFPSFRFWTYTKIAAYENLFDDLKNANIVKSIIPRVGINFGHCDYIINAYYTLKAFKESVYICRCGIDKMQHCENCGVCATYKYVLFVEHSTGYQAEKDPLYEKLIDIVNHQ